MRQVRAEKGIPMPEVKYVGNSRRVCYPWEEMAVGDSFLHEAGSSTSVLVMCQKAGKRYGRRFAMRTTAQGFRVWRIQ